MNPTFDIAGVSITGSLLREIKDRLLEQFNGETVEVRIYNGELSTPAGREQLANMCQRAVQILVAFDHMEIENISTARKQGSITIFAGVYVAVYTSAEPYEVGDVEENVYTAHKVLHRVQTQLLSDTIPVFTGDTQNTHIQGKLVFDQVDIASSDIQMLVLRVPFYLTASVDYSARAVEYLQNGGYPK